MARYYTPSDVNIDKIGIPPDLEVLNMPVLSKLQEEKYVELMKSNEISKIVDSNKDMKESDIAAAAKKLSAAYPLDERLLRRLIRIQVQKNHPAPLYDMDWDLQLKQAISIINDGKFKRLVSNTKTLKQLQEEVASAK